MSDVARAVISGRLVRDPEISTTSNGTSMARFSVASDLYFGKQETSFFNCLAFGSMTNFIQKLGKGTQVTLDAQVQQRRWESDGQKRSTVSFLVDNISAVRASARSDQEREQEEETEQLPI